MEGSNKRQKLEEKGDGTRGLLTGYYSSDDGQASGAEEEVRDEQDGADEDDPVQFEIVNDDSSSSDEEENAIDLDDLSDSDDAEDTRQDVASKKEAFWDLLTRNGLDPYGSWEIESLKVINHSVFFEVDSNKERKRLFDDWCKDQMSEVNIEEGGPENDEEEFKEGAFVKYVRFIEQVPQKERLFIDFKKNHADDLGLFDLSMKDMEKIYKEFIVFEKRPIDANVKTFEKVILGTKIFHRNTKEALKNEAVRNYINELGNNEMSWDVDESYIVLHRLEQRLNIPESLVHNVKYYIVDVKTRLNLIVQTALKLL